jgi:C-terminal processing protease CtpA/Prc
MIIVRRPRRGLVRSAATAGLLALASLAFPAQVRPQKKSDTVERGEVRTILLNIEETLRKHYYDPNFNGMDINARFAEAQEKIDKINKLNEGLGIVAWALDGLNDSHTFFIPPPYEFRVQDGWRAEFVGDKCYIIAVRPGSDAEAKNVRPGDRVLEMEGIHPTRESLPRMIYVFHVLAPRKEMRLKLVSPEGAVREVVVKGLVQNVLPSQHSWATGMDVTQEKRARDDYYRSTESHHATVGISVFIWQMPQFNLNDAGVDEFIGKARKHAAMILDLRGNSGGAAESLTNVIAGLLEHDVEVGTRIERDARKSLTVKSKGRNAFGGRLIVLVDSSSASASEILARTVQIEKRGMVIGDRTAGEVAEGHDYYFKLGGMSFFPYGARITQASFLMSDGKNLERSGVAPDVLILPTANDLAAGRDPVLAAAVGLLGETISPEQAGALLPKVWRSP